MKTSRADAIQAVCEARDAYDISRRLLLAAIRDAVAEAGVPKAALARAARVSRPTLYTYLHEAEAE